MQLYASGARIAGRYEVAGRPLMGGMGIVYLCFDHQEQRHVALKTFRPEYLPDRGARDRFLQEGETWVRLGKHPHIVRCYEVFQDSPRPEVYLVLELVAKEEGRRDASLRAWLTLGRPLPVEQALLIALQIARGMAHAVETIPGFVHRDLKPENMLVGADRLSNAAINRVRVTDFGLVKGLRTEQLAAAGATDLSTAASRLTGLGALVGTPLYMAPEQWESAEVEVPADIYALGCIVGEMVTGSRLVQGATLDALQRAHQYGRAWAGAQAAPAVLHPLLQGCLAVEPGQRYTGWDAVETAIEAAYRDVTDQLMPGPEAAVALNRVERLEAGLAYIAIGASYLDIAKADVALGYFEHALRVIQAEGARGLEAVGHSNLGNACVLVGDLRQAIGHCEQSLSINRRLSAGSTKGSPQWTVSCYVEGNVLGTLGNAYCKLGDFGRTIGYYEQALAIHREIGDKQYEGVDLGNLGNAYRELRNTRCAISCHEQALVIAREIDDRRSEGNALGNLGIVYTDLGEAQRAIDYLEQALAIRREIGDRRGESADLGNLGNAYRQLGEARRAIGYYEKALAIHREIGDHQPEGYVLGTLGGVYQILGDARQAIGCYEQALAIHREIGDHQQEGYVLGTLGDAYRKLGDARRAIGCYEEALVVHRKIADRRGEGNHLLGLATAYTDLDNAPRAIDHYEQALAIYIEIGDHQQEGYVLATLGGIYRRLGDVRRAIEYYERSLVIHREIGDRHGEDIDLGNLGSAYAQQGEARRAIEFYEQALAVDREIGDQRGEGIDLGNLATVYLQLGDLGSAIGYYERALAIRREVGDRHGESHDLTNLGNACADLGDARRAMDYYGQSLAIYREVSDQRSEGETLRNLALTCLQLGDVRQAIVYYERDLAIEREIGDITGVAFGSFNVAVLHTRQGNRAYALPHAREAARLFTQMGHAEYAQRAQQLGAELERQGR